jgi:hypothetical protein
MRPTYALLPLVFLAAASAQGSIISFTGPAENLTPSPPAFVTPGTDYATVPGNATVWDEQQGVLLTNVAADMVNNSGSSNAPIPGLISAPVDSHFFHFRGGGGVPPIQGTITFSGFILGVAFDWPTLNNSDAWVAPSGTTYDTAQPRGIDLISELITINGNVLTFDVAGAPQLLDTAQFRVFTEVVPTPSSIAALALSGILSTRRRRPCCT